MTTAKFNIIIPPQDIECNPQCQEKIAAGDPAAFEWLYKNYCSRLYDYLLLLSNDKQLSEDIVQEVFLKIWNNKESLTTIKNFNGYIYFIAKNLLHDKWRKKQNEKLAIKNLNQDKKQSEQNLFYQRTEEQTINAAIKTLPTKQQLVYRLIREEGHSRNEVSKKLNIAPNTVKATLQNALHNLRKNLCES